MPCVRFFFWFTSCPFVLLNRVCFQEIDDATSKEEATKVRDFFFFFFTNNFVVLAFTVVLGFARYVVRLIR